MQAADVEGWMLMSLLDDYFENTEIFKPHQNLIDQVAFDALMEKHGEDFAKGYLKAIHEMAIVVGDVMMTPKVVRTTEGGEQIRSPFSQAMAYGKLWHLHKALYQFVLNNELPVNQIAKPIKHGTKAQNF